jgi:hypothetical protein
MRRLSLDHHVRLIASIVAAIIALLVILLDSPLEESHAVDVPAAEAKS